MTLYERKIQYNVNNMSLCENNCIYKGYNLTTSQVGCDCQIKSELTFNMLQFEFLNLYFYKK